MSVTVDAAISELKSKSVADPSAHLKPKGREQLEAEIERWKSRGLRAHVLVCDPGDSFRERLGAWDQLGYDGKKDLLLVFNTRDWAARGWGLSDAELAHALEAARPHAHEVFAQELIDALDQLGRAAIASGAANDNPGGGFPVLPVFGGIAVVATGGLIALAIRRRNRLAKEGLASVGEAKASADRAYSELVLACEELPGDPQASELQIKASELKKRVNAIAAETDAKPARGNDPVTVGKIRQLENELAALRSTVLQKQKEQK
jgi:hypothetical protein